MFDLEQSISNWRRQMLAAGITKRALLDELEGHLRDETERLMKSGLASENAFRAAVEQTGNAVLLKREFKKISGISIWLERLMIAIAAVFLTFIIFVGGAVVMCFTNLGDRVMAAAAMVCTVSVAFGWKHVVPFLPTIPATRKRLVVGLACITSGFVAGPLYCDFILPQFAHFKNGFATASSFWAVFIIAVFLCLGVGLGLSEKDREIRGIKKNGIV